MESIIHPATVRKSTARMPGELRRLGILPGFLLLGCLLALAIIAAICLGAYRISPEAVWQTLLGGDAGADRSARVLIELRLPRIALGLLVGAGFGAAGSAMQALLRNPLADPGLIGVSSGAALGAAIMIVIGAPLLAVIPATSAGFAVLTPLAAFAGALAVALLVYRLAAADGRVVLPLLLLAGVGANALAGAVIGLLSYVASDTQLRSLTFWNLGSLADANWQTLGTITIPVALGIAMIAAHTRSLNALQLGEAEARHLGVPVRRVKHCVLLAATLSVGALVSCTGQIGFIGLVAPHCIRLLFGPDQRVLLPGSILLGALLVVSADVAARTLAAPTEIPLGVLTALLGAPFFMLLILRSRRQFGI